MDSLLKMCELLISILDVFNLASCWRDPNVMNLVLELFIFSWFCLMPIAKFVRESMVSVSPVLDAPSKALVLLHWDNIIHGTGIS